jgi:hypothetical protein
VGFNPSFSHSNTIRTTTKSYETLNPTDDSEYDENWEWTSVLPYETLNPTDARNHGENVNLNFTVAAH